MNQDDQDRVDGRELAEDHLADLARMSEEFRLGWWRRIKRALPAREIDPKAMTDDEAREYGKRLVGFGKYHDQRIDSVPLDYWAFLADANRDVQRYLRNRRIAAEHARETL